MAIIVQLRAPLQDDVYLADTYPDSGDRGDIEHWCERWGARRVWYWYMVGGYDGAGQALAQMDDGQWVEYDLGHCSCFGPWDDPPPTEGHSLDELREAASAMHADEMSSLYAAAMESTR